MEVEQEEGVRETLEKLWGRRNPKALDAVLAAVMPADGSEPTGRDRLLCVERALRELEMMPRLFDEAMARSTTSYRLGVGSHADPARPIDPARFEACVAFVARHVSNFSQAPYPQVYAQELAGALLALEDDGLPLPLPLPRLLVRDWQRPR